MRRRGRHAEGLAALVLFGIFAVCVLAVLLTGAGAYQRLTERDRGAWERQTREQYIAARVRQADRAGGVTAGGFAGMPALRLGEESGYVTWVYCHEGWLMELYTSGEAELAPEDGTRLLEAAALRVRLADGLLEIGITGPEGGEDRLYLALRGGEGAAG